jgi:hypothetical protein
MPVWLAQFLEWLLPVFTDWICSRCGAKASARKAPIHCGVPMIAQPKH